VIRLSRRRSAARRVAEREARQILGMPAGHPESLTRPLSRAQERRLAALAARLWPHDEYAREL
jgi:hypothetical protein